MWRRFTQTLTTMLKTDISKLKYFINDSIDKRGDNLASVIAGITGVTRRYYNLNKETPEEKNVGLVKTIASIFSKNVNKGFATGWKELDRVLGGGIKTTKLYVLGAENGEGKSIFALNVLLSLSNSGVKSCYFDLENGATEMNKRILQINWALPDEYLDDDDNMFDANTRLEELYKAGNFVLFDNNHFLGLSGNDKHNLLEFHISELATKGFKVFVIDHLQTLEEGASDSNNAFLQIGKVVEDLKNAAINEDVAIIILHHLRKPAGTTARKDIFNFAVEEDNQYRDPRKEDFKGTSKIIDYATNVIGITKKRNVPVGECHQSMIKILKDRSNGENEDKRVYLEFDISTKSFISRKPNEIYTGEVT